MNDNLHSSLKDGLTGRPDMKAIDLSRAAEPASSQPTAHYIENGTPEALEPIAIVGFGLRLPGRVHNAADYWDLLVNGKSGRCRVPKNRYNVDAWLGTGRVGGVATEFGYFLEDINLAHIDPSFWSMSKQEAEMLDPQQRLFLEVVYEAFESAGASNWRGEAVGVYVGTMGDDWSANERRDDQSLQPKRAEVYGDYILANRASYEFDLRGPSMVIRTACSSSLVALHMACQDLRSGDCTSAIVGGVNLILEARETVVMTDQGVLSPSGSCKSFDAEADGYARGEGVSAVYVKKLSDAFRDGDPIRGIIRSTCVGGDGRTPGLTTPSPEAHERLMRRGYQLAGCDISRTAMIECHGTGTPTGDPLEVRAVANVWGEHGIYIGSVKPNIGHGEGASGLSSIIKMVLALEKSTIPPNINFKTPNPHIPWKEAKLMVPTVATPWPIDRDERVSVNSFGIGGANAHVVLESARLFGVAQPARQTASSGTIEPHLLVFSCKSPQSLQRSAQNVSAYLSRYPGRLADLSYSLGVRRETHSHRAFCVTDGQTTLQLSEIVKSGGSPGSLVWAFTGQGAQWPQMGKELLEQQPLVRHRIDELDSIVAALPDAPSWTIKSAILTPKAQSRLHEAEFSQPCLAALQIALFDLLRSWGVSPAAVVGHSSGETAAAYACGAITAREAILLAYHRGQITPILKAAHNGSMAAVGLGRAEVDPFLRPGVIVGCENSPASVTLSGEAALLEEIMREIRLQHPDVLVRALQVECAYHSPHMQAVKPEYESRIDGSIEAKKPLIPFYSSVTGKRHYSLDASYWVQNLVSPVLFDTAVRSLLVDQLSPTFIEIGPHFALAGPTRQILQSEERTAQYIPTLVRNSDGVQSVLKTAGQLFLAGHAIQLSSVVPAGNLLTDLPTYPWHYDREYWVESRLSRDWRLRSFRRHELLGDRLLATGDAAPAWRCMLRVDDVPWLRDHEILGQVLMPASGYICMAGEAVRQLTGSVDYTVRNVHFLSPLVLTDDAVEIVSAIRPADTVATLTSVWYEFSISSLEKTVWTKHVTGQCRPGLELKSSVPDIQPLPRKVSASSFYTTWRKYGLNYGPRFRTLSGASSHVTERVAVAELNDEGFSDETDCYPIHPTRIDSAFHVTMIAGCRGLERNFSTVSVPRHIEELYVGQGGPRISLTGNVGVASSSMIGVSGGQVVLQLRGLEVAALSDGSDVAEEDPHAGAIVEWKTDIDFVKPTNISGEIGLWGFLSLLAFKKPNMRVLEIGAEKDTTSFILSTFRSTTGARSYGSYIRSDSSEEAAVASAAQFHDVPGTKFIVLDLLRDPTAQGLDPAMFDLIIVSSEGISTKRSTLLQHAASLLRSHGHLLLYGIKGQAGLAGTLTEDTNKDPNAAPERQRSATEWWGPLSKGDFDASNALILQDLTTSSIVVKQVLPLPRQDISILCTNTAHPLVSTASRFLEARGYRLEFFLLGQDLPASQPVICLVDLEGPCLFNMTADKYAAFQKSVLSVQDVPILWVTGTSQVKCETPNFSLILGAARSIRREQGTDFITLELERFDQDGWAAMADITASLDERRTGEDVDPDMEYVFSEGAIKISRFQWVNVAEELLQNGISTATRRKLAVEKRGGLQTLHWREAPELPLEANQIEVETRTVALSTKDVLASTTEAAGYLERVGFQGAGVVRRVGANVLDFCVGDRVAFVSAGCCSTSVIVPSTLCAKLPDTLTFAQSALLPSAFITAHYALSEVARIQKGQSVLIHSAMSNMGLAAINIAQIAEAQIFCTVMNEDECSWVISRLAIDHGCIFNSRDPSYQASIVQATSGHGADVVIHTLSEELLPASWNCVADFGTLVRINTGASVGKGPSAIDLGAGNRTFVTLDFEALLANRPVVCARLLAQTFEYFQRGSLEPLNEVPTFDAAKVEDAFRSLQQGGVDDAILEMSADIAALNARPRRLETTLRPDRTYLIVGGLGGLGWSMARFLVDKGARHLIFFSRSAGTLAKHNPEYLTELTALGCTAHFISGTTAHPRDLHRALSAAPHPIAGILHAAMVLADANFPTLTFPQWQAATLPKVQGTWALHTALAEWTAPLDFFVLLSSLSGLGGMVGQANYAAANAFLDAFAQFRRARGLVASVLDLGVVEGVGVLARDAHRFAALRAGELHRLREVDVLDALEVAIAGGPRAAGDAGLTGRYVSPGQLAVGLGAAAGGVAGWKRDARAVAYGVRAERGEDVAEPKDASLKGFLAGCTADPEVLEGAEARGFLAREIGATLGGFLMRGEDGLDLDVSLGSLGVDSLVGIELRNWFRQKMGVVFTVVEIRGAGSIARLGEMAAMKLAEKHNVTRTSE